MKKLFCGFMIVLTAIFGFTACSSKDEKVVSETTNIVYPSGAVIDRELNKLEMEHITITLPDNMRSGRVKTENGTNYYVWKGDDFVLPSSHNILFYVYEGLDSYSPDLTLTDMQVRSSVSQNYVEAFKNDIETGRLVVDPNLTLNNNWFTLCFTGFSGADNVVTSYGTYCYPKSYYGIYLLQNDAPDHSRYYYGFVFSNDVDEMMTEKEYDDLFGQLKNNFSLEEFYTIPQSETNYDPDKDTSTGYNYEQLTSLFNDTMNYYIIKNGVANENALSDYYDVVSVVDGDTIVVDLDGVSTTVRLIGVDTPESVHSDESKNTDEGILAAEWTTELLDGNKVCLEYDVEREDDYGRVLAYVYIDDDGDQEMVNKLLLEKGMAMIMTVQPNSKYAEDFYDLQLKARNEKKGFWETGFFSE